MAARKLAARKLEIDPPGVKDVHRSHRPLTVKSLPEKPKPILQPKTKEASVSSVRVRSSPRLQRLQTGPSVSEQVGVFQSGHLPHSGRANLSSQKLGGSQARRTCGIRRKLKNPSPRRGEQSQIRLRRPRQDIPLAALPLRSRVGLLRAQALNCSSSSKASQRTRTSSHLQLEAPALRKAVSSSPRHPSQYLH